MIIILRSIHHIYVGKAKKTTDYSTVIGHLIKEKKSRFSMRFDVDLVVYALLRLCLS